MDELKKPNKLYCLNVFKVISKTLSEKEKENSGMVMNSLRKLYWKYEDELCVIHHQNKEKTTEYVHMGEEAYAKHIMDNCLEMRNLIGNLSEAMEKRKDLVSSIPRVGAILMDSQSQRVVLVMDSHSKSWTFPRGKVVKNEKYIDCCIREVKEETGLDLSHVRYSSLCPLENKKRKLFLYRFVGPFEKEKTSIQCRQEIGGIRWLAVEDLMSIQSYDVRMFIKYVSEMRQKCKPQRREIDLSKCILPERDWDIEGDKKGRIVNDGDNSVTFDDRKTMTVDEMFRANEALENRKMKYNGDPQRFGASDSEEENWPNRSRTERKLKVSVGLSSVVKERMLVYKQHRSEFCFDYSSIVSSMCY